MKRNIYGGTNSRFNHLRFTEKTTKMARKWLSSLFYFSYGYVAISARAKRCLLPTKSTTVRAFRIYVENGIQFSQKTMFEIISWHECANAWKSTYDRKSIENFRFFSHVYKKVRKSYFIVSSTGSFQEMEFDNK